MVPTQCDRHSVLLGFRGGNDGCREGVSEEVIFEPGLGVGPSPKSNVGSLKAFEQEE